MKTTTHMQTNEMDRDMLVAALTGYQIQAKEIEGKMMEVRRALGIRIATPISISLPTVNTQSAKTGKHRISAEGRKRIAAAQKKRWAKTRRNRLVESMEGSVVKKKGMGTGKGKVKKKSVKVKKAAKLAPTQVTA